MKKLSVLLFLSLVLTLTACTKEEVESTASTVTSVIEKVNETATSVAEKIDSIEPEVQKTDLSEYETVEPEDTDIPDVLDIPEVAETTVITKENREEPPADHPTKKMTWTDIYDQYHDTCDYDKYEDSTVAMMFDLRNHDDIKSLTIGEYLGEGACTDIYNAWSDDITIDEYCYAYELWYPGYIAHMDKWEESLDDDFDAWYSGFDAETAAYNAEHPMSDY